MYGSVLPPFLPHHSSLPLEMDFRHEAANAKNCVANFAKLKHTSLVVPEILWSQERILVMEFIEGGRVDDLEYLREHNIDRSEFEVGFRTRAGGAVADVVRCSQTCTRLDSSAIRCRVL